jgi:hypothetical protein
VNEEPLALWGAVAPKKKTQTEKLVTCTKKKLYPTEYDLPFRKSASTLI